VVAVTAFAMAEDQANATRAGFDGYLEKPISVRGLVGEVQGFLQGGRS
jgi:two-component system, cell cycle response regulator DivK